MFNYIKKKIFHQRTIKWCAVILVLLVTTRCVYLESVEQPSSVTAGEMVNTTLRARVQAAEDRANIRFVIGVLVPRSWRAAENMTIEYTSNFGNGSFEQVPANIVAPNTGTNRVWPLALMDKFGVGPNLIDDMEWVVFWTRERYNIVNGDKPEITAQIAIKSGMQNMRFKFGYYIGTSIDGLNDFLGGPGALYKSYFSDCFEVMDGEGAIIDFCNPPQSVVDPFLATDNDLLTITYNRDILPGPLTGDDVYLCATAELADGNSKTICIVAEQQKLKPIAGRNGQFEITIWPRQYFGLQQGETIERITYHFTDPTGAIKIGYGNTDEPFSFTFNCE